MRWFSKSGLACAAALALAAPAGAQKAEDSGAAAPKFKEGDVITMDKIESIKPFLPP